MQLDPRLTQLPAPLPPPPPRSLASLNRLLAAWKRRGRGRRQQGREQGWIGATHAAATAWRWAAEAAAVEVVVAPSSAPPKSGGRPLSAPPLRRGDRCRSSSMSSSSSSMGCGEVAACRWRCRPRTGPVPCVSRGATRLSAPRVCSCSCSRGLLDAVPTSTIWFI